MLKFLLLAAFFAVGAYCASERNPYGPHLGAYLRSQAKARREAGRIVGGEPLRISEAPYQLSLQFLGDHFCGGSILTPTVGITAAHCMFGYEGLAFLHNILVGHESLEAGYQADAGIQMDTAIVHEDFDYEYLSHDVCIFSIVSPLEWSDVIQPIRLPEQFEEPEDGTVALVSGWGVLEEGGWSIPDLLHGVEVFIVDLQRCNESYTGDITEDMVCAAVEGGGRDACQGDSGGPLVINHAADDGEETELVGIVSWGYGCARAEYPGVYAGVGYLRDWIDENIEILLEAVTTPSQPETTTDDSSSSSSEESSSEE